MVRNTLKKWFLPVWEYYRDVRFHNLKTVKYNHLLLILYWPIYGLFFLSVERILPMLTEVNYHPIHIAMDDYIPFCEFFIVPYHYWFVFLIGFGLYWLFWEPRAFRDWMWTIILTYSTTVIIYLIYPTMQELRPVDFPRDNLFTDIVRGLYTFDTNTNVCPSIHVLGSLATMFAGLHSKRLSGIGWKLFFVISTVLISVSTVFLKQHSALDIFAALLVGTVCYLIQFALYPLLDRKFRKQPTAPVPEGNPLPPSANDD